MLPLVLWEIRVERASGILIALNPAWVPRLDGTAGGTALPFPGRKYMLSQVEPETIEPSCVIASGVSERGALQSRTLMGARKPCTKRLYASNGSVCEGVRLISTWLLAPYVLSFPLHRLDSGSLPSTLKFMSRPLLVRSPQSEQSFGKKTTSPMSTFASALGPGSGVRALSLQPLGF